MCVVFYVSVIWINVYAFAILSMVHCGSAFEPGASGLPFYCTPPVCVPAVLGALALWWHKKKKRVLNPIPGILIRCPIPRILDWNENARYGFLFALSKMDMGSSGRRLEKRGGDKTLLRRQHTAETTISKPQSLTSVRIKDCTLRVPNKTTRLFLYEQ